MPGSGFNSKNLKLARRMLEYCRFSYKFYAQTCAYPLDPFYEAHGAGGDDARTRLLAATHKRLGTESNAEKFDPVPYKLTETADPSRGIIYRGGVASETKQLILFLPREIDKGITAAKGFDLSGNAVDGGVSPVNPTGSMRCGYFQGRTGMTQTHPTAGWTSWLGAVVYDPVTQNCVIVFRGSRSGAGARAATQAQFKSKGSPDWVTDMNHLKEVSVQKYHGANLSCGFHYAYESCQTSLRAAYRFATNGATPKAVYVTGHSLGGALAQCCYLDLTAGGLTDLFMSREGAAMNIMCYPISAPPIVLGRAAHQKIAIDADATQIFHYFCPKDAVHASPLVEFSGMTFASSFLKAFTHPLTDPFHMGSEIALPCTAAFPDAHEPEEVWKGMNGGTSDERFWPRFDIAYTKVGSPWVTGLNTNLELEMKQALRNSVSVGTARARAAEWAVVIKNDSRRETLNQDYNAYDSATQLCSDLRGTQSGSLSNSLRIKVTTYRQRLEHCFREAQSHRASSAAYYSLLQGLTAAQLQLGTPIPTG